MVQSPHLLPQPCVHLRPAKLQRDCAARGRYVPLYASQLLAHGRHECAPAWDTRTAAALVADFWADAPALLPTLGAKPHWVQLSEREALFRAGCGGEGGLPLMCHALAEQVMWATPEALTAPHPLHGRARFLGRAPAHNNSLAVPYLGRVHDMSMASRAAALASHVVVADKQLLVAVAEGPRVTNALPMTPMQAALAQDMIRVCRESGHDCTATRAADFLADVEAQRQAWFCVAPPGDTPTSIALADCFAAGLAVPAVFDEYLYDLLPYADVLPYRTVAAYVPRADAVTPGVTYLDHLAGYGLGQREAMLRAMQSISQALQYAVQPQYALVLQGCLVLSLQLPYGPGLLPPLRFKVGEALHPVHSTHIQVLRVVIWSSDWGELVGAGPAKSSARSTGPTHRSACVGRCFHHVVQGCSQAVMRLGAAGLPRQGVG